MTRNVIILYQSSWFNCCARYLRKWALNGSFLNHLMQSIAWLQELKWMEPTKKRSQVSTAMTQDNRVARMLSLQSLRNSPNTPVPTFWSSNAKFCVGITYPRHCLVVSSRSYVHFQQFTTLIFHHVQSNPKVNLKSKMVICAQKCKLRWWKPLIM